MLTRVFDEDAYADRAFTGEAERAKLDARDRGLAMHLAFGAVQRRIEVSVESFLLAPFLMQDTDLVTLVPERAETFLRRTGDIRILESPVALPVLVEMLWWHPRADTDPAHTWLRGRVAALAGTLAH